MARVSLHVEGIVQGVGFRPFVYCKAMALGLSGWVKNGCSAVEIEAEGSPEAIEAFVRALEFDVPKPGAVARIERRELPARTGAAPPSSGFSILPSEEGARPVPLLPADLATCADCMAETLAPEGRRRGYPFTTCARCGPRCTIIESLPYDRDRTSMRTFALCDDCQHEYEDPRNRRFHAETIACPRCGPRLSLLSPAGEEIAEAARALRDAAAALRAGRVVALRGVGGFQLLVDATDSDAVRVLRRRKRRDEKPFAVLFADAHAAAAAAVLSAEEMRALVGPEAPIVLARRRVPSVLAPEVAPRSPLVGAMLPASPLHRLIAEAAGRPLICTSGNLSGEPLAVDVPEALTRLAGIADLFLVHDRPIVRAIDDSVVRAGPDGISVIRRARGFAPLSVARWAADAPVLGMGAHLKSTMTLAVGGELLTSQHLGDLDGPAAVDLLERTARDMTRFFDLRPSVIACDLHPDYASSRLAERLAREWGAEVVRVQHHHAHVLSVVAEHGLDEGEVLGLAWDGVGLGADGSAWGGEALVASASGFRRVAHLRPFPLPGGDRAAREPRRSALGLLYATLGPDTLTAARALGDESAASCLLAAMTRGFAAPLSTSVGRLFDAVAALLGLRDTCSFEGQAAMELEGCAATHPDPRPEPYPLPLSDGAPAVADTGPLVRAVLTDRAAGRPLAEMAARFHAGLVDLGARVAERVNLPRVVLAGGCFQNDLLTRALTSRLRADGFDVRLPARVPTNDGGISVGQAAIAARSYESRNGGR
ncbi:carbamoyltransferase HypF [Polyangium sorediatum]|uniref:Carbamoyltransferase n=1 Tax=Polyangium sorediatum TaxID=889274 RepID=A0ABT6P6K0_9BACT|nr:carbamoyltransferase HypF [Polyangium sorediatum]MDI1436234.1 carbamoyltransferase HypF [Polyangium sorediatum]